MLIITIVSFCLLLYDTANDADALGDAKDKTYLTELNQQFSFYLINIKFII